MKEVTRQNFILPEEYLNKSNLIPKVEQIELLLKHIIDLQKDKGNLTDKVRELEQQIEKMKCCGNCIFSESDRLNGTFCHKEGCFVLASAKCKLWEY